MTKFNEERFNYYMQDVIKWNSVARTNAPFSHQDFANQTDYIDEEIDEAIAGLASKDLVELLDGIADTFVTLTYKCHMALGTDSLKYDPIIWESARIEENEARIQNLLLMQDLTYLKGFNLHSEASQFEEYETCLNVIHCLIKNIELIHSIDMDHVLQLVCDSNWSKYPVYVPSVDYDLECRWIEQYRKKQNVSYNVVEVNGVNRVVFRDNHGEGKICKPQTFVEPGIERLV